MPLFRKELLTKALVVLLLCATAVARSAEDTAEPQTPQEREERCVQRPRQLTFVGGKNGEAYFSADGQEIVFQGVREPGNPFYQIYRMNRATGETARVSPGTGRTTCAFFHPKRRRFLFASTHLDPDAINKQKEEIEKQKAGPARRYAWDFDPFFDIFESDFDGQNAVRLSESQGYDAEGSYSPDGSKIVFCSMRDGDQEIYVMDASGKNAVRLTNEKGYDGGPFFSPDGKQIVWRHFEDEAQKVAEIWIMSADGSNKRQLTTLKAVSWAPYFHPSMEWIVFAANHEDPAFELYAIRPDGKDLTRLTYTPGFDGLPAISPDGQTLMWTSNRADNKSQIFMADLKLPLRRNPDAPAAAEPRADTKLSVKGWWNTLSSVQTVGRNNIEHAVARQFKRAELNPPNPGPREEETSYILGPSVAGWFPPTGESDAMLVFGARLGGDDVSCGSTSALIEAAHAFRAEQKNDMNVPGLYAVAGNEDEMPRLAAGTKDVFGLMPKKPGQNPHLSAFVSFAGLGGLRSRHVVIRGAATSPGWRELAEKLAARHPDLHFTLIDDPASAPELAALTEMKVPGIAFGGLSEQAQPDLDAEVASVNVANTSAVIAAAMDFVRLIAHGTVKLPYTPYDAAAARAAASAAQRPYLGTVPEYKTEGISGVKLSGVRDGSPAQKAGLKGGDVIVALGGLDVKNVDDYLKVLEALKPGAQTVVKVQRDGKNEELTVTIGSR